MSSPESSSADWLDRWTLSPSLRDAEEALAHWLREPDVDAFARRVAAWTPAQARRAGYALHVAWAAGLLDPATAQRLLGLVTAVVEPLPTRVVLEAWHPDLAFGIGRLQQRSRELALESVPS